MLEELDRRVQEYYEKYEAPFVRKLFAIKFPNGVKVNQYDRRDALVRSFDSFEQILQCKQYKDYYYRYDVYSRSKRGKLFLNYFGVNIQPFGSPKLEEDLFFNTVLNKTILSASFPKMKGIPDCDPFFKPLYYHFHQKMKMISALDPIDFEKTISVFLQTWPVVEISDLSFLKNVSGIYCMVLDEYKQCYIGKSNNIKQRIMQHWSRDEKANGTNIDTFRAYDTTRIFVLSIEKNTYEKRINQLEEMMISSINEKYLLNIMPGGDIIGNIHDPSSIYIYPEYYPATDMK